jgi:hypothetical protein
MFTDGIAKTFPININNIDITNPVNGNQVFSIDVKYWIPVVDIRTDGIPLTNRNSILFSGGSKV